MKAKEMWACGRCGETHRCYSEAEVCCCPTPSGVFCCSECDAPFDDFAAAEACCVITDPDADPLDRAPSAAELEAAGQLRLELPEVRA